MKKFITWLYSKYVFMPELLSYKHPRQQYEFLCYFKIDLCPDTELLRIILSERMKPQKTELRLVE